MPSTTLTYGYSRQEKVQLRRTSFLFRVLSCADLGAAASRHCLEGVDVVEIGRHGDGATQRTDKSLVLGFRDRHMSSRHLRLLREGRTFVAHDAGSKNGTFVNGTRIDRTQLADGDVLRVGHTILLYRCDLEAPADIRQDLVAQANIPAFATLSPAFASDLDALARVARHEMAVLLLGETGTGKEVVAAGLHALSLRRGPFVPVHCGAIPAALVESELFGHRRGAFSGANEDQVGLVRSADGGTLFLDEIGDATPAVQLALLRVLQQRDVRPVGATRAVSVDVRFVAATLKDLDDGVAAGRFREDLLARLTGFVLELPPLRERREDIGIMLSTIVRRAGGAAPAMTPEAGTLLLRYGWPRNVRELEQCVMRALSLAAGGTIDVNHLPREIREARAEEPARRLDDPDLEQNLRNALARHGGNISAAAAELGTSRSQVHRWARRFGVDLTSFRTR
jgi:DNA-binding NtrC family response regulator